MAQDKKSFVAYCDWIESFEELSDEEAGRLVKHLFRYVNDKNPEAPDKLTKMCFIPIKQALKRDLNKYETIRERNKENGKKGGRPKKPTGLSGLNEKPKKAVNDNVSVNDNVNVNEKKNKKGVPPSFDSFLNHAREKAKSKNIILDEEKVRTKFDSWLENDWCDLNGKKIINWKVKITSNITYWQESGGIPMTKQGFQKLTF